MPCALDAVWSVLNLSGDESLEYLWEDDDDDESRTLDQLDDEHEEGRQAESLASGVWDYL
jgi:hypothetical protein